MRFVSANTFYASCFLITLGCYYIWPKTWLRELNTIILAFWCIWWILSGKTFMEDKDEE